MSSNTHETEDNHVTFDQKQNKRIDVVLENLQELAENNINSLENVLSQNPNIKGKYVPGPLPKEKKSFDDIRLSASKLIISTQEELERENVINFPRFQWRTRDDILEAAMSSSTVAAYINSLNENHVHKIGMQMVSDTSLWISKIFRFFDSLAFFSMDNNAGLIRVIRMNLYSRYPKYSTLGYEALFTRPPVIYYCDVVSPGLGQNLCMQLGLPLSCITSIPCCPPANESQFKMDCSVLEKCIVDDIAAAKTPLLVIANAGMPVGGDVDDLSRIQEICTTHNIWFHVNGHNLAALSLVVVSDKTSNIADSVTLNIGEWLGLRCLPHVTLYKAKEMTHIHAAGLMQVSYSHLDFVPLWFTLQALGHYNLCKRIHYSFEIAEVLLEKIEQFPELRIISKRIVKSEDMQSETASINSKKNPSIVLLEAMTSVIVFQYFPKSFKENADAPTKNPPYYDNLNSWLVQLIARDFPCIGTDVVDLEQYGICLRICPLKSTHLTGTSAVDVEEFLCNLQHQISILNYTVIQKEKLYQNHRNHRKLRLVEIENWAGVGGVRYIPDFWANRVEWITDTGKQEINQLNSELVAQLRVSDAAFSLGEADDGMLCVRFGMVCEKLDMDELIDLVLSAGQELEESSKFLETMSEMIKHGIEEANKALIEENEEKIMQEGVLRQVPVIGSLVSWWYPSPKETGIKGRSFDLSSGTIESTENIYRYHMQIKEGSKSPPGITKIISPNSSQSTGNASINPDTEFVTSH